MSHIDILVKGDVSADWNTRKRLIDSLTIPVTVVLALFLVKFANPISYDPDLYWHLKTGEYIVTTGTLPYTDIFSHTAYGKEWVLHEWLSQVLFYAITQIGGLTGLWAVVACIYVATFYLLFRLSTRILGDETKGLIVSLLFFAPLIPFASPRPQIFTYLFFAIFLWILFEWKYFRRERGLMLLPPLMLVWPNLHGAFVAGIALLALFLVCEWITWFASWRREATSKARLKSLGVWTALAVLATLANPRFIEYWLYPFHVVNMEVAKGIISEWQSPNFHLTYDRYFLGVFLLLFAVLVHSRKKPSLTELAVPTFFIVAGFTAARHLPLACFAALPFFALFLRYVPWANTDYAKRFALLKMTHGVNRQLDARRIAYLNVLLLCGVAGSLIYTQSRLPANQLVEGLLPVKAANFIVDNAISGKMFNEYGDGGYLIYRLYPQQKVFIDGRADMYGDDFMNEYLAIINGAAQWQENFEKHSIDYAVLPRDVPLRQLLLAVGTFKLVYDDERRSILLRDVPKYSRFKDLSKTQAARNNIAEGNAPSEGARP